MTMRISKYAKQKHGHWAACHKLRINWDFFCDRSVHFLKNCKIFKYKAYKFLVDMQPFCFAYYNSLAINFDASQNQPNSLVW